MWHGHKGFRRAAEFHLTVGGLTAEHHLIPPGHSASSETFFGSNENIATSTAFRQNTPSSVAVGGKPALRHTESGTRENILRECCEILKTHLLGIEFLMTLNENGAVKVVPLPHKPTLPQSRWDGEAMREASGAGALLSERCHVKNHNWMCFIKLYGCLMMPRAVWLRHQFTILWKWDESFITFFFFDCKHLIRCAN